MELKIYTKEEANKILAKYRGTGIKFLRKRSQFILTHPYGNEHANQIVNGEIELKTAIKMERNAQDGAPS